MLNYLPLEIVQQVLFRLSINSLLRFSSTCKTWYNHITSPDFISAQLRYTKSLPNTTHLLIRHYSNEWPRHRNIVLYSDDEAGTFEEYERFCFRNGKSERFLYLVGCCNGLICLANNAEFSIEKKNQEVVLWNPILRRTLDIPESDVGCYVPETYVDSSEGFRTFGFVFDHTEDDYKILRIQRSSNRVPLVEAFRLSTGLWEDISCKAPFVDISTISRQVDLKGVAHWIGKDNSCKWKIITLNANEEVFGSIELPAILANDDEIDKYLFAFEESLFLIRRISERYVDDKYECHFDIWKMGEYNVVESWNQVHTWIFDISVRPVGFRKNGEIHWVKDDSHSNNDSRKSFSTNLEDSSINYLDLRSYMDSYIDYVGSLILLEKSLPSGAED